MTPSELLQKFLHEKDAIIFKATGQHLYDPVDYGEARIFSDGQLREFFENISEDGVTCIWCTVFLDEDCNVCGYGKRHGECCNTGSHYDTLCRGADGRIIHLQHLTGMKHLVAKAAEAFKEITSGTQTDLVAR